MKQLLERWKFKFYIWVLKWEFIDDHIKKAEARAVETGRRKERLFFLTEVADHCKLDWPPRPDAAMVDMLKKMWLGNYGGFAVMYKFPVCPVENDNGEFTGYTYNPDVNLKDMRWVLGAMFIGNLPAVIQKLK